MWGCWQVIVLQRDSLSLGQPDAKSTIEVGYYASSLSLEQRDEASVAAAFPGHWWPSKMARITGAT
jgi:hypothetical protein